MLDFHTAKLPKIRRSIQPKPPLEPESPWLTTDQASSALKGINSSIPASTRTLERARSQARKGASTCGPLPRCKIRSTYFYHMDDLFEWVRNEMRRNPFEYA